MYKNAESNSELRYWRPEPKSIAFGQLSLSPADKAMIEHRNAMRDLVNLAFGVPIYAGRRGDGKGGLNGQKN